MGQAFVFGYGSLVNRGTHTWREVHPARLPGWRRAWQHAEGRETAFLAAVPAGPGDIVEGVIAAVPEGDWAALDLREASYERAFATGIEHEVAEAVDIHLYRVPEGRHRPATGRHPVLLSYLDVVIEGYLEVWGTEGVRRFFATTDGWDAPIRDDRAAPLYPRAAAATDRARRAVDAFLDRER